MATIPIEVIVQDKASPEPTPTPSDSGETNIVVPDTGAGTVENGSNGGGIGSATNIILPAIILVLAIGAIVALLIRRQQRRKKANDGIKEYDTKESKRTVNRKEKLTTVASGTIAILAATVLVGNLVIPATKAATSVEPGTAELETVDKITITATREIDSDITVATVKNTSYATANLDFGYKVIASMIEGATTANLYLNGDETSEYYIAPVSGGTLADNTWGYTLEEPSEGTSTTYLPIPLVDTPATITKGNDMVEDEAIGIYYTIKVDKDLPAGSYKGELEYTLTNNNFPSTLTTMQGMTTEICENTFTPGNQVTDPVPTATLEDIRDHKTYTIAKLADGKCWMTQNLDLDLKTNGSIIYNSTNTNLTVAGSGAYENGYTVKDGVITWTPANATINFTGSTVEGWVNSDTAPYTANPGDVYYYTSNSDANDIKYNLLTDCVAAGHTVEDCKHYHAGNYYNWSAAVASNDSSSLTTQYDNAANSICPAGWRLQEGPSADNVSYSEVANMTKSYNDILGPIREQYGTYSYPYLDGGFDAIRVAPLWLNRAGMIMYGSLSMIGEAGNYRYNTIGNDSFAYNAIIQLYGFTATNGGGKGSGQSVRCVAEE